MFDSNYFRLNQKHHLVLFANCFLIEGAIYSSIVDLQRENYLRFPSKYSQTIKSLSCNSIHQYLQNCSSEDEREETLGLITYLVEKEVGWIDDNIMFDMLPPMDTTYYPRANVHNAILELNENSPWRENLTQKLFDQLEQLDCQFLDINLYGEASLSLDELIKQLVGFDFISFRIRMNWYHNLTSLSLDTLFKKYFKLTTIELFAVPENINLEIGKIGHLVTRKDKLVSHKQCGCVTSNSFIVNSLFFTESQHHNTCLNRKISIDVNGDIKNCPSMPKSYGNIKDTTLQEALKHPDFKKYWNIKKDEITKCKDCEFRHICTDCRAYRDDPDDIYSAPLKCGYDPYTGKWEEWSTNPLKQKAIDFYEMREIL